MTGSAFDAALKYLSFKDRTCCEVITRLREKGFDETDTAEAVEKLIYYRYIDDVRYALSYIKDNMNRKGVRLITRELASKGVDKTDIQSALEAVEIDEAAIVREIFERRFSDMDMEDCRQRRRVVSYFLRHGFSYDSINIIPLDTLTKIE